MYRSSPIIRWRKYNDRYSLEGNACRKCNKVHYPKKHLCECNSKEFENKFLEGTGKLLAFTEISAAAENYSEQTPYCIGIIELKEGPRITGWLSDCKLEDLKIGMEVQATFRRFYSSGKKGAIHYGTKFIPVF